MYSSHTFDTSVDKTTIDRNQSGLGNLVAVSVDGLPEGHIQRVLVIGSTLSASWDVINDAESNGINAALEGAEDLGNGLSKWCQAQETMLSDHGGQQLLVDLNKLVPQKSG